MKMTVSSCTVDVDTDLLVYRKTFWFRSSVEAHAFGEEAKERYGATVLGLGLGELHDVDSALEEIARERAERLKLASGHSFGKEGFE